MKIFFIYFFAFFLNSLNLNAQILDSIQKTDFHEKETQNRCFIENTLNTGFGFGMQLSRYQSDFGLGINVTSPLFLYDKVALRMRGNLMFNEHPQNLISTLTPYSNMSLGIIGFGGKVGDYIRLYGEGGVLVLFPSDNFSSEQIESGGYGIIGVEFFMSKFNNYFFEVGHAGTGAKEDKIATQPLYSNGMIINAGVRFHLK